MLAPHGTKQWPSSKERVGLARARFSAGLFARAPRRADDHVQLARALPAGQWLRLDAELLRKSQRHAFAARREVDRGLGIAEVRRAPDLLDRVAERADVAG